MDGGGLLATSNPAGADAATGPQGMQMMATPAGGQQMMMPMGADQQAMFAMMMQQNQAMMLQAQTAATQQMELQQNTKAAATTAAAMQGSAPIPKDVQLRFYKTRNSSQLKLIIKDLASEVPAERELERMNFDDLVLCAMGAVNLTNDQGDRLLPWATVLDMALENATAKHALIQDRGYPADADKKRMKMHGLLQTMLMSDRLDVWDTLHIVSGDDNDDCCSGLAGCLVCILILVGLYFGFVA
eukprot:COSAG01_NODE_562_length_15456_cov_24.731458_1_plen_243_part_00